MLQYLLPLPRFVLIHPLTHVSLLLLVSWPPQIIQSKGHNKGVDWWAIGILIFEMLAGFPPFFDENPYGIYQKILGGKVDWPKWVRRCCCRCSFRCFRCSLLPSSSQWYTPRSHWINTRLLTTLPAYRRHFSMDARDLLKKLLTADRTRRLGCLFGGARDIKEHPWFKSIDWTAVYNLAVSAPYVPRVKDANDTSECTRICQTLPCSNGSAPISPST